MVADRIEASVLFMEAIPEVVLEAKLLGNGRGSGKGGRAAGPITGAESDSLPDDFRFRRLRRLFLLEEEEDFLRSRSPSSSSSPNVEM